MKNTIATKLAAAACTLALVATPAVAFAQPATTTENAPIVAQSSYDYTASYYIALDALGFEDTEVSLTTLDTYYDEDGVLVDLVGFNAYGVHYDVEVEHYYGSFCSWTCYFL